MNMQGPQTNLDVWETLKKFNITSLSQLTKTILSMEEDDPDLVTEYDLAFAWLKEFESMIRSHIYTEHHAQEFFNDAEATQFA